MAATPIPLLKVHMPAAAPREVAEVLSSGFVATGARTDEFERGFGALVGNPHVVATNCCSSAIMLALHMAGIKPGDDVISTPLTCLSVNESLLHTGANIIWADIDPQTGNIAPASIHSRLTDRTKAIVYSHWVGRLADIGGINQIAAEHGAVHVDTDNYIRSVLTKALGDDKASNLLSRILQGGETNGIEGLKWMDAATVADLVKNEHPQIIATILVHLEPDHASEILNLFADRLRNDVIMRIATLEGIQPNALRELNDVMLRLLSGSANMKKAAMGGVRTVADILNFMGSANETTVIEAIKEYDPDLAQKVLDALFGAEEEDRP